MNPPRWRRASGRVVNQVRLTVDVRRHLRGVSADLDQSCPALVRVAISHLIVKYQSGGERRPARLSPAMVVVPQNTLIEGDIRDQLRAFAVAQRCAVSDLVREAVCDFLQQHHAASRGP